MRFMNEYDIGFARMRFGRGSTPNRLGAAIVIDRLREWADENSDGWAYWPKPVNAAAKLIDLVESTTHADNVAQERVDATDEELAAAVKPVKAFLTRQARETDRFGNPRVSPEQRELILRASRPLFEVI